MTTNFETHSATAGGPADRMQHVSQFRQGSVIEELSHATAQDVKLLQQDVQVFRTGVLARSVPMCEPSSLAARKRCLTGDVHAAANSFSRKYIDAPPGADMENETEANKCACNEYPHAASCGMTHREAFALEVQTAAEQATSDPGVVVDVLDSWLSMQTQFDPRRDGTNCAWNCGKQNKSAAYQADASALEAIFQGAA
jgi:hypothetical protein